MMLSHEPPANLGLDGLNPPQIEAVVHAHGPLIVFAGAGSGKTRVITYRIANLLATHRVPPYRILAVTFTNKAAQEMRDRLETIMGGGIARDLWVGTFHSMCVRLLRVHHELAGLGRNFVIYDTADQKAVMKRVLKELRIDEKRYPPQKVLARIGKEKQEARGPEDFEVNHYFDDVILRCFKAYERHLQAANAVDFSDLLLRVLRLAEDPECPAYDDLRSRFSHVLVDEFQDVNQVQYRLVRALAGEGDNICVVGDDDQCIYQWRGADIRNIRGFTRDFPNAKLVKLEQNYRSSGNIVSAALGVIRHSADRQPKELWTDNSDGSPVGIVHCANERDEAAWVVDQLKRRIASGISPRDLAVFYRVHAQSRVLEEVMRHENVPYQIVGGQKFFDRVEVKDLLSYLRVLVNPQSDVDLFRIINVPARKIGKKTIDALLALANENRCSAQESIVALCGTDRVGTAAKRALRGLDELLQELMVMAETAPPLEIAEAVLERTGYSAWLEKQDTAEADARVDNLREFLGSITEFEEEQADAGEIATLSDYLARISLISDVDTMQDVARVPMMTVHAAKGLEFDGVFITGMEERLFPLRGGDPGEEDQLEEERRLAYVAITRGRKELFITHTNMRMIYGQTRYNQPSRFLLELPHGTHQAMQTEALSQLPTPRAAWGKPRMDRFQTHGEFEAAAARQASLRPQGERYVETEGEAGFGGDDGDDMGETVVVRPGARVRHPKFGVGVVRAVNMGQDPVITVKFAGWAPKRIKLSFLSMA
ncbi:MAG: UvrD-helicase domain-containing protein [Polyangiaceae bacterium]